MHFIANFLLLLLFSPIILGMGLFDVHCHLLPEIDDSKAKWEELESIFQVYSDCGLDGICFTPHLYNPYVKTDVMGIREAFARAAKIANRVGLQATIGSEVFVDKLMKVKVLPIMGKYGLIEFNTQNAPLQLLEKVQSLLPLRPMIAHVERYSWLEPESAIISVMRDMGCIFQVNGKALKPGSKAERYVEAGIVDVLASDCHGNTADIVALAEALGSHPEIIQKMRQLGLSR